MAEGTTTEEKRRQKREQQKREKWGRWLQAVFWIGLVLLLVLTLRGLFQAKPGPLLLWGLFAVLMIVLLISLGTPISGHWYGVLIDSRNRTSLSRLQITLWTVITLSAFLAVALPRHLSGGLRDPVPEDVAKCELIIFENDFKSDDIKTIDVLKAKNPDKAKSFVAKAEEECQGKHPLRITFPAELVAALGISTASLAGSSLIKGAKKSRVTLKKFDSEKRRQLTLLEEQRKNKEDEHNRLFNQIEQAENQLEQFDNDIASAPDDTEKTRLEGEKKRAQAHLEDLKEDFGEAARSLAITKNELKKAQEDVKKEGESAQGLLYVNGKPEDATLGDLFQGDEVGNYNLIDLAKVQMFFFTVAVLVSYGVALYALLKGDAWRNPLGVDFPEFSASLITLLGISHAGYLSVKSVDHTKTEDR